MTKITAGPLAIALFLAVGCTHAVHRDPAAIRLAKSPAVHAYAESIHGKIAFVLDDSTPDYDIYGVGEDFPDHFARGMTMKINKSGDIFLLKTEGSGEEQWVKQ